MKQFLDLLIKPQDDYLTNKINKEPIVQKQWTLIGCSIIFLLIGLLINVISIIKSKKPIPADVYTLKIKNDAVVKDSLNIVPVTVPYPHQTFANINNWVLEAIGETYSFGFTNYDKKVKDAEYYFTPDGYASYIRALKNTGVEESIKGKRLEASILALQTPVMIGGGFFGNDQEYWRFRVPTLINFYGGKNVVSEKYMLEVLVQRIPSSKSHRGIAISEYNMMPQ